MSKGLITSELCLSGTRAEGLNLVKIYMNSEERNPNLSEI